ncbi:MAG TPA: hypothetical protein VGS21_05280 [Acidimicrobiales bacterium]|nr:hypothetical protein [Acidimicrobiales bacterium]
MTAEHHHTPEHIHVGDHLRTAAGAVPAWLRPTEGEHRWQVTLAVAAAIGLQLAVPHGYQLHPDWLIPAIEGAVVIGILIRTPGKISRRSAGLRMATLFVIAAMSLANSWSLVLLVHGLVNGTKGQTAGPLLLTGAAIWGTNVIVFSLWYWEFDRGGPGHRAQAVRHYPDLMFPQMANREFAAPDWEPQYFDYLYTSFTNAAAFSPTDVMPLSRWTKMLFLVQSSVSLISAALVIARAVNILQ